MRTDLIKPRPKCEKHTAGRFVVLVRRPRGGDGGERFGYRHGGAGQLDGQHNANTHARKHQEFSSSTRD
jgi:hypothetical protein